MNNPGSLVEGLWDSHGLSDYQWKWEFLRHSDQFRQDLAHFLNSNFPCSDLRRKGFVDIWDLPHPGDGCLIEYAYLQDFRSLLCGVASRWKQDRKDSKEIERDLLRFAKALAGDGSFYHGLHSLLLNLTPSGAAQQRGRPAPRLRFLSGTIRLPAAMRNRHEEILSVIETEGFNLAEEPELKPYSLPGDEPVRLPSGLYRLSKFDGDEKYLHGSMLLKFKIVLSSRVDVWEVRSDLSKLLQDEILNKGLPKVMPWKRKRAEKENRAEKYSRQLGALEVDRGFLEKRLFLEQNEADDGQFSNYIKEGRKKVEALEKNASARRAVLQ